MLPNESNIISNNLRLLLSRCFKTFSGLDLVEKYEEKANRIRMYLVEILLRHFLFSTLRKAFRKHLCSGYYFKLDLTSNFPVITISSQLLLKICLSLRETSTHRLQTTTLWSRLATPSCKALLCWYYFSVTSSLGIYLD